MSEYNAAQARAKRPCPIWVDAFQRDTQHLEADEVGAYMLLLMAMWTRKSCDFPDDDRRLAAVCRVSQRLWKSRIGSVIREFLIVENGVLVSKRLQKEAAFIERQCQSQHDRGRGKKSDKSLNKNKAHSAAAYSTGATVEVSREQPTQQPNNLHLGGDGEAGARTHDLGQLENPKSVGWKQLDREPLLIAMGADPNSDTNRQNGRVLGGMVDMEIAQAWIDDLELTTGEVLTVVTEVMLNRAGFAGGSNS